MTSPKSLCCTDFASSRVDTITLLSLSCNQAHCQGYWFRFTKDKFYAPKSERGREVYSSNAMERVKGVGVHGAFEGGQEVAVVGETLLGLVHGHQIHRTHTAGGC